MINENRRSRSKFNRNKMFPINFICSLKCENENTNTTTDNVNTHWKSVQSLNDLFKKVWWLTRKHQPDDNKSSAEKQLPDVLQPCLTKVSYTIRQTLPNAWPGMWWKKVKIHLFFLLNTTLPYFQIGRFLCGGVSFSCALKMERTKNGLWECLAGADWLRLVKYKTVLCEFCGNIVFLLSIFTFHSGNAHTHTYGGYVCELGSIETIRLNNLCPIKWNTR